MSKGQNTDRKTLSSIKRSLRRTPVNNLTQEERSFLPPADALVSRSYPIVIILSVGALITTISSVIVFAALVNIDIYAEAPGRIEPSGKSKIVQAPTEGRILTIYKHDGEHVVLGEPLVEMDRVPAKAEQDAADVQLDALGAEIARRRAEQRFVSIFTINNIHTNPIKFAVGTRPESQEIEKSVYMSDINKLTADLAVLESKIVQNDLKKPTLQNEIESKRKALASFKEKADEKERLAGEGWVSKSDLLDARIDVQKAMVDLATSTSDYAALDADDVELRKEQFATLDKFKADNSISLQEIANKAAIIRQQYIKASAAIAELVLRTPVTGTIQNVSATTLGQVVASGQTLMTVVPDKYGIQVELLISEKDVGFVHEGQQVRLKVRAYPFTQYGMLTGHIVHVARDSVDSKEASGNSGSSEQPQTLTPVNSPSPLPHVNDLVFPALVQLDRDFLLVDAQPIRMKPGMAVEGDIRTGTRHLLEYIFAPLVEVLVGAGHGR